MDLLILGPVLLFSFVAHEYAHARVALREGDDTAYRLGRVTLNPIPHIDLFGTILVPAMLIASGSGFLIGWAKPVPVVASNFRDFRMGDIRVSLAGVALNFLLAVFNLLPVPPLDGSHLVVHFLPSRAAARWRRFEKYATLLFVGLLLTGWVRYVLWPAFALDRTAWTVIGWLT